jgi:hypothetical protein
LLARVTQIGRGSKSDTTAELQPSLPCADSEMHSNQDADTSGNSKPVRTSKRQLQHPKSSAEGEKLAILSKAVESAAVEKAKVQVVISNSKTQTQQGAVRHIISRTDGEENIRLRNRPDGSQKNGIWVRGNASVSQGEVVEVLRIDFAAEQGFAFIRTANNIEGFVRSDYIRSTTTEAQNNPDKFHKKQKLNDDSTHLSQNPCVVLNTRNQATESIDCSSPQVVTDH